MCSLLNSKHPKNLTDVQFRKSRAAMEEEELNPSTPPCLYLISAFLSVEPTDCLLSFSRECGGGSITEGVQTFILEHCINQLVRKNNAPSDLYVKNFLKKVIVEVESSGGEVLDGLYEQFAYYITSLKEDNLVKDSSRVCKTISFIFPNGCLDAASCPKSKKVEVPLLCSLNMLEGDTGCSIWPSSLFLAEFILSYPELFSAKSCFEVGAGVGLVGIALATVKASKVILSDGDMSTLVNLKLNLELNHLNVGSDSSRGNFPRPSSVECKHLPWESASEDKLQNFNPDIVLGADVIYDPLCLPHLVRVLTTLLNRKKLSPSQRNYGDLSESGGGCKGDGLGTGGTIEAPRAYLATVIRNVETFDCFLSLACQSQLSVLDVTEHEKPRNLLPYMRSYERSSIRLFNVSLLNN